MKYPKVIENVQCTLVCTLVGRTFHRFKAPDVGQVSHLRLFNLTGFNQPKNVKRGDMGRMEYRVERSGTLGLWWFEKY